MTDYVCRDQESRMKMLRESQERAEEKERLAKSQKPQEPTAVTPEPKTSAPKLQSASAD
ncbi:hypothetical protein IH781_00915 [Patescibacteria group bacterium]|nr:hypothetical protein [Patescibacteria group bacterium]